MHLLTMLSLTILLLVSLVTGDIYLHNPRGSNNRNRETSTNTDNNQRMYDSQNNNKGGYCWGPPMTFYEGSLLQIEWTNQHGCGVDHPNVDCDLILQYMCNPLLRDGFVTTTITQATMDTQAADPSTGATVYEYGMHEPYDFYAACSKRLRNLGLFEADQNLGSTDTAMRTRQNDNRNNPHGFECEEERDYYPYWHPTPWRDIAVLTSNTDRCTYFKEHSQNVEGKFECSVPTANNEADCITATGQWSYTNPWNLAAPECIANGFSRDNHLGNTKTGYTNTYSWVIPRLNTMTSDYLNSDGGSANCALRIRYNISSGDYPGWNEVDNNGPMIDASDDDAASPVQQDPYVGYGSNPADPTNTIWDLRLAINTNQYGRTFQDRSYMFHISKRPANVDDTHRIINLNVRGKRGNIVEAYPAVEYDFTPNELIVSVGDFVHFQWTGCDTNPNYAGEGTQGTDRSNIVEIINGRKNYPRDFSTQTMFPDAATAWKMAHLNQYGGTICASDSDTNCCKTLTQLTSDGGDIDQNVQNCFKLNDPAVQYFDGTPIQMKTVGTYNYMSTRNNNFTNRSQKASIVVQTLVPTWGVVVASAGACGFVGASGIAGGAYYASTHPASMIATYFSGGSLAV